MPDWYAQSVGAIGSAFGGMGSSQAPASPWGEMGGQSSPVADWYNVGLQNDPGPFGYGPGYAGLDTFRGNSANLLGGLSDFGADNNGTPLGMVGGNPTGNAAVDQVANANGVPPAVLAALVNRESSGDWASNNYVKELRGERMLPYVGIFESTARSWGLDFDAMIGNQQAQLAGMAKIIGGIYQQQGFTDWGQAAAYYFAGPNSTTPGWTDEYGMSVGDYQAKFNADVASYGGATGGGGSMTNNSIVQEAMKYQGVAYNWGAVPGKGQDPWQTGWDCSGFTYWLDQTYGTGQLPQGSHYQYQYAQQTNRLFSDTSQLQPGDLVFFDTGFTAGGGSDLNHASHVGLYIGNGQMIHASSPEVGTIVSSINDPYYQGRFLGAMHETWSGGSAYGSSYQQPQQGSGSNGLFGGYSSLADPNAAWRTYRR